MKLLTHSLTVPASASFLWFLFWRNNRLSGKVLYQAIRGIRAVRHIKTLVEWSSGY